jgi:uncharacterized membrane protein YccC
MSSLLILSLAKRISTRLLQQFKLRPGQPAIFSGLRTLIYVGGPIGLGVVTNHAAESAIAVIAALFVGMVDVGGAYRQKGIAMTVAAIGMTIMLFIANLVGRNLWIEAPATFAVMFIVGFTNLFGRTPATIGLSISLMFIVALAKFSSFHDLSTVLEQCALCLAGGMWAVMVSLVVWVQRPYTPAMEAVASCYSTLSRFVEVARETAINTLDRLDWTNRFLQAQDEVTQAVTTSRNVLSAVWTEGKATNLRGNQLLILTEDANQIVNSVVALVEQLLISSDYHLYQQYQQPIQHVTKQLVKTFQQISEKILKDKRSIYMRDLDRELEVLVHQRQMLRTQLKDGIITAQVNDFRGLVSLRKIVNNLKVLTEQTHTDAQIAVDLHRGDGRSISGLEIFRPIRIKRTSILDILRENLTFQSTLFRHALRLALVATLAEILSSAYQVPNGYWITLTAVVALKPNFGGTTQTTLQRVIGTTIGGVIGIAIIILIHQPIAIWICLLLLLVTAMAVRPLSYSLFILLFTPAIILLLNATGKGGWEIGVVRVLDSFAGGALALLGSYLLFPHWERRQIATQLKTTLRANLTYFKQVVSAYTNIDGADLDASFSCLTHLRHQAAVENANVAAAAQRLISEPRHVQGEIEPTTTFILYIRRFFNSVTTLAEHRQELSGKYQCSDFKDFADAVAQILENLADAFQQKQIPAFLPPLETYLSAIHDHIEQLQKARVAELPAALDKMTSLRQAVYEQTPVSTEMDRIAHEIYVIHDAVFRMQSSKLNNIA